MLRCEILQFINEVLSLSAATTGCLEIRGQPKDSGSSSQTLARMRDWFDNFVMPPLASRAVISFCWTGLGKPLGSLAAGVTGAGVVVVTAAGGGAPSSQSSSASLSASSSSDDESMRSVVFLSFLLMTTKE